MVRKRMPIGIDDFVKLRTHDFYYVDKTGMIKELLDNWGEVNLFTRPRRFGKSLNMSMLRYFFECGTDKSLFDGLAISKEDRLCKEYMGQYPVISITLKDIDARDFDTSRMMLVRIINEEARRLQFLLDSNQLSKQEKQDFKLLLNRKMDDDTLFSSLKLMAELLQRHFDHKVIILIDEYDVPLAKASRYGYYRDMVGVMRNMFHAALKTNPYLEFAVLTGCLRVSYRETFTGCFSASNGKESIFTGLNNPKMYTLLDATCDEQFGFTDEEVVQMLDYYGLSEYYDITREWYDGYQIGNINVYNPWDVINWCDQLLTNPNKVPKSYWTNSSSNEEVRNIFRDYILELFEKDIARDGETITAFCGFLKAGNAAKVEEQFTGFLRRTISIRDTAVKKEFKESFYHGILLGILEFKEGWSIESNRESGDGYYDIAIEIEEEEMGMILEVKYAEDGDFDKECKNALAQINDKQYTAVLIEDGMRTILKYGIACYKKQCKVVLEKEGIDLIYG